jgi:hypothetical protein
MLTFSSHPVIAVTRPPGGRHGLRLRPPPATPPAGGRPAFGPTFALSRRSLAAPIARVTVRGPFAISARTVDLAVDQRDPPVENRLPNCRRRDAAQSRVGTLRNQLPHGVFTKIFCPDAGVSPGSTSPSVPSGSQYLRAGAPKAILFASAFDAEARKLEVGLEHGSRGEDVDALAANVQHKATSTRFQFGFSSLRTAASMAASSASSCAMLAA